MNKRIILRIIKRACGLFLFLLVWMIPGNRLGASPTEISLVLPPDIYDLPTAPSTRHVVYMPSGPSPDYTYHHSALITWWKGKFFVAWTASPQSEWTHPYEGWVASSVDLTTWTSPAKIFEPGADAYITYLLDRLNAPPNTPVSLDVAPRCWYRTDDRLYLMTLCSGNGNWVGRCAYTEDGETWQEIDPYVLDDLEFNQGLGAMRITWSNHHPIKLSDGRLMAFNLNASNAIFPITSDPEGLTNWSGTPLDLGECPEAGEPGGWEGPDDGVLHGVIRGWDTYAWHTYSLDRGVTWSTVTQQVGFRDNPGNKHFGSFPDGSIWYVGGPVPGNRIPLVLGISRDGWTFDENYIIRGEQITPIWYSLGKSEDRPGWEYPSAVYHDGFLYVAYSRTRDFIEVSKVDLSGMNVTMDGQILDLYGDGIFNLDGKWNALQSVQDAGQDSVSFDEAMTPGRLRISMDASPEGAGAYVVTRNDVTLPEGEHIRCKVRLVNGSADPNTNAGIALMAAQTAGDRSHSFRFAIRGDGIIKMNAYEELGVEYADVDHTIPGFAYGQDYTLRIDRVSENEYSFSYGIGSQVTTTVASAIVHPGETPPIVPAMYLANGLADCSAEYDNYLASAVGPAGPAPPLTDMVVDDFLDGTFSANWNSNNHPQYDNLEDIITFDEASLPGVLRVHYDNTGSSFQNTMVMRENMELVPGSAIRVDVRITSGPTSSGVWVGLGLATVSSGLDNDRSNTIYYGLRNDGIVRGNFYGASGVDLGGVEPVLTGYQVGDEVALVIYRQTEETYGFYMAHEGGPWRLLGGADYGVPHTPPNRLGLYLGIGNEDFSAEFTNCKGYKLATKAAAHNWLSFK